MARNSHPTSDYDMSSIRTAQVVLVMSLRSYLKSSSIRTTTEQETEHGNYQN